MAKIKKKNVCDKIHMKKEQVKKKKLNPFEVHINKEKMCVLGRKVKNDRGLPGVARTKAINKRKNTLLPEYRNQNKSNQFTDRRIGERNWNMSEEDRAMARFAAVKVKSHKKSIFNLADDEVLTHKGQTLSEIEKFDEPLSDEDSIEEIDDKAGKLGANFVGEAHFGGGVLTKTASDGAKSHKDLIDQLIAESKKRKAEKQKMKEATIELTEKLDTEWKDLMPLISKNKKGDELVDKSKIDDYDKVMRELKFEARGTVSDRLKTEDELAKEEKTKLEELEQERLERMKGFVDDKPKNTHRSADDLEDDFVYENDDECMLSYNQEGEANVQIEAELNGKTIGEVAESNEEETVEEKSDNGEEETDSEDNLSDLKSETSEEEEEEEIVKTETKEKEKSPEQNMQQISESETNDELERSIKSDLMRRKEIMEKAREELPYTFSLPDSYEALQKVFENQSCNHQSVIIERMIKCNHPSLGEGNKDNLGILFACLLQYLNDVAIGACDKDRMKNCFEVFTTLTPQIYNLAQLNPENVYNSIKEVIKEKHDEFAKNKRSYPGLEVLIFLKLVSVLFCTSDFRHQIVTPCFIFMEQMLNKCRIKTKRDITYGLFIVTLVLEFTDLSKRFMPAAINFLSGLVHLSMPKFTLKLIEMKPPSKPVDHFLVLNGDFSGKIVKLKMVSSDLLDEEIDEEYKIRTIYTTLKLIEEFDNNLSNSPSNVEIFERIVSNLHQIPTDKYPETVQKQFEQVVEQLNGRKTNRKLTYIVIESKRPKALRMYEPKIEEVFDGKRYKVQSREKAERDKILHKLKKETKGALREIRRDKSFLGRVRIREQIKSDKERMEKVKRIYAEAAVQQNELNNMERKKKRK